MTNRYTYNPACTCQWCANNGQQPEHEGSTGHSWCYEDGHNPPSISPWKDGRLAGTPTR